MNDPHASLSLFAPREVDESSVAAAHPNVPRVASAKPPPQTEEDVAAATPKRTVKTNEKKYNHFEFGDGEEATPRGRETNRPGKPTKGWDFEDFVTPEKTAPKTLPAAVRHFGWSDDEEETSPVRRPVVHKARPDADPHFEFDDNSTPAAKKPAPSIKGSTTNKGQGLYKDHVTGDDDEEGTAHGDNKVALRERPIKNENRSKDFAAHWDMTDNSPQPARRNENQKPSSDTGYKINIAGNGMGGRKGTEFSLFDEPADEPANNRRIGNHNGINTAGDGMGGRKGADKSFWDF